MIIISHTPFAGPKGKKLLILLQDYFFFAP